MSYILEEGEAEVMKILDLSESLLILQNEEGDTYTFTAL